MDGNRCRVLLVEDNTVDAMYLQDELAQVDNGTVFEVVHEERLTEALSLAQQESFNLMVLDLALPDSDGLNTFLKAKEVMPSVPIVVMSGLDNRSLALEAVRNGAQDYLVKGQWDREVLERSLTYSVERYRLLSRLDQSQKALKESEERFRALFESVPDLIYIKDRDLRITHVNPATEDLLGIKSRDLIGSTAFDLYGKKSAEQIERWDLRALDGESVEEEHTRTVNSEQMTFLDIRVPLRNVRNEIIGICCISRDITERKRATPSPPITETEFRSPAMLAVIKQAAKIASTDGIVLLTGESGSGKDYLARWIHNQSLRSSSPYFAVNCAALSAELAESELFGHEAGSFTGARGRKRGMLELAEGGTLLLNEIGELPLPLQSKLLTFLDTRSFLRVGGERSITVDARLMAATHRDLGDEASQGRFLEPLYHRLNVFNIKIPPLRERAEDMPILVDTLIAQLAKQMQLSEVPVLDPSLVQGLNAYKWPGNVRELRNVIERALMLWDGEYFELKLPAKTSDDEKWSCDLPFPSYWKLREVTDEITKSMVMQALRRTGGNKKEAAKMLGTSRDALYRYIKRFGIRPELLT